MAGSMWQTGSSSSSRGAARAASIFCRQFLVKASSVLPARDTLIHRPRAVPPHRGPHVDSDRDSTTPGHTGALCPWRRERVETLGQRTHKGPATAAIASQSPYNAAFSKSSRHTAAPAAGKFKRPPYPLLLHALDTHQPWIDSEPSGDAGNMVPELQHKSQIPKSTLCSDFML